MLSHRTRIWVSDEIKDLNEQSEHYVRVGLILENRTIERSNEES